MIRSLADFVINTTSQKFGLARSGDQYPALLQGVMKLLAKDSAIGGLPGLVANFHSAGLGDVIDSWLGRGPNQPINGAQIEQVLGGTITRQLAGQAGMTPDDTLNQLAQMLPVLVDRFSPRGEAQAMDKPAVLSMLGDAGQIKG